MKVLVFEGSAGEISDLLERMPQLSSGNTGGIPSTTVHTSTKAAEFSVWTKEKIERMYSCIYGHPRKLVDYIVSTDSAKVSPHDAQKHLKLDPGPAIAGVISGITKHARRITKYREARLIDDWFDPKTHEWFYTIPEPALSFLREVLKANKKSQ